MSVLVWFLLGRANIGFERYVGKNTRGNGSGSYIGGGRSKKCNSKLAAVVALSPLAWSTFVACSRLVDNWHHPSDIVAGMCLGLFFPVLAYHLWYPSVISQQAGVPLAYLASPSISPCSSEKDFD